MNAISMRRFCDVPAAVLLVQGRKYESPLSLVVSDMFEYTVMMEGKTMNVAEDTSSLNVCTVTTCHDFFVSKSCTKCS